MTQNGDDSLRCEVGFAVGGPLLNKVVVCLRPEIISTDLDSENVFLSIMETRYGNSFVAFKGSFRCLFERKYFRSYLSMVIQH